MPISSALSENSSQASDCSGWHLRKTPFFDLHQLLEQLVPSWRPSQDAPWAVKSGKRRLATIRFAKPDSVISCAVFL